MPAHVRKTGTINNEPSPIESTNVPRGGGGLSLPPSSAPPGAAASDPAAAGPACGPAELLVLVVSFLPLVLATPGVCVRKDTHVHMHMHHEP